MCINFNIGFLIFFFFGRTISYFLCILLIGESLFKYIQEREEKA